MVVIEPHQHAARHARHRHRTPDPDELMPMYFFAERKAATGHGNAVVPAVPPPGERHVAAGKTGTLGPAPGDQAPSVRYGTG